MIFLWKRTQDLYNTTISYHSLESIFPWVLQNLSCDVGYTGIPFVIPCSSNNTDIKFNGCDPSKWFNIEIMENFTKYWFINSMNSTKCLDISKLFLFVNSMRNQFNFWIINYQLKKFSRFKSDIPKKIFREFLVCYIQRIHAKSIFPYKFMQRQLYVDHILSYIDNDILLSHET